MGSAWTNLMYRSGPPLMFALMGFCIIALPLSMLEVAYFGRNPPESPWVYARAPALAALCVAGIWGVYVCRQLLPRFRAFDERLFRSLPLRLRLRLPPGYRPLASALTGVYMAPLIGFPLYGFLTVLAIAVSPEGAWPSTLISGLAIGFVVHQAYCLLARHRPFQPHPDSLNVLPVPGLAWLVLAGYLLMR
jgi:hypothetical protein